MNQVDRGEEGVFEWVSGGSGAFRMGFTGRRRNVHESLWFYCTFSIILRNSSEERREVGEFQLPWSSSAAS